MQTTVVVPIIGPQLDPERVSEQALPTARMLAERTGATLLLISVMNVIEEFGDLPETDLDRQEIYLHRAATRRTYLEGLIAGYTGDARVHVVFGNAPDELIDFVETIPNPIIVMASHGRKGLRRVILGSVAFEVVQRAWCPVVVVPAKLTDDAPDHVYRLDRIVVPLDRTHRAESVLDRALAALGTTPLDIRLVQVITPPPRATTATTRQQVAIARELATEYLRQVADRLTVAGHRVTCTVREGVVEQEIALAAEQHDAGLIVMATRGRTGISRFVLGSVTEGLVQGGTTPLLIVRPSEDDVATLRRRTRIGTAGYHPVSASPDDAAALSHVSVGDLMTRPAIVVRASDTVDHAAELMLRNRIGSLPVVDDNDRAIGIITRHDLLKLFDLARPTGDERNGG